MAQTVSPTSIVFTVQRGEPELVTPAKPTPYEFKPLSDLDWFRNQVYCLWFYPHNPSKNGVDPAKLIRSAIAETLVFYYPFAGRIREGATGKLTVECTGEGILFTEADADVTLDQFGYPLVPPFSCLDQLLYEEPASADILNCPLVLIQVTRLKCGGFIFGVRLNHIMCDASGTAQFLSAIGEMARGATSPSVLPVWERHVLNFMNPPLPEHNHDVSESDPLEHDLRYKSFIFTPTEISALRRYLPLHLRDCSTFEIVTASIWKCRVAALQLDSKEETTSLIWPVNLRSNNKLNHYIPYGYYGNALGYSIARSTAKEILENPLCYTLQLLRNGKEKVNIDQYRDESETNSNASKRNYFVSDLRHAGSEDVDFGWGKALYGGPLMCMPTFGWYYQIQSKGKNGIVFPFCLPKQAMDRFEMELNNILKDQLFSDEENAIISKL
ncbi:benzyl alcohol O-benzoyltransferase-like [Euphorbia lathyris]|uniref:benzyl alcohol O-benzoyltransferase-like n=1 Tax=Euphorbia lathyris TaxID=212925 RepID=UPI003313C451